jgi:hypothetical protein
MRRNKPLRHRTGNDCMACSYSAETSASARWPKPNTDAVGELRRVENCASRMASLKVQDHGNAYAGWLVWEHRNSSPTVSILGLTPYRRKRS